MVDTISTLAFLPNGRVVVMTPWWWFSHLFLAGHQGVPLVHRL